MGIFKFSLFLGVSAGSSCGGETPHSVDPIWKRKNTLNGRTGGSAGTIADPS